MKTITLTVDIADDEQLRDALEGEDIKDASELLLGILINELDDLRITATITVE